MSKKKTVLIVDDNPSVRRIMHEFLSKLTDWDIVGEAGDGSEAIRIAKILRPDLILMDYRMPNMNGIEAASVLKRMMPDIHIVLFTMFDESLGSRLTSAVGVDLIVPKHGGLTNLVESVQHLIEAAGLTG